MTADSGRIIAGGRLIFFFLFSFLTSNVYHCLFCFLLFNFSSHSINFSPYSFFFFYGVSLFS
jgi:hypothetical protein